VCRIVCPAPEGSSQSTSFAIGLNDDSSPLDAGHPSAVTVLPTSPVLESMTTPLLAGGLSLRLVYSLRIAFSFGLRHALMSVSLPDFRLMTAATR